LEEVLNDKIDRQNIKITNGYSEKVQP